MPKVSVIVPVKDDRRLIDLIKALENQTFKDFEVLIADSSKERIFKGETTLNMKYYHTKPMKISEAMTFLSKKATSEIIAITESDCAPNEHWLEDLYSEYVDSKTIIVGAQNIVSPHAEIISFGSLLLPKKAFSVKFDKNLKLAEDTDWFFSLKERGFKFKQINKGLVTHYKNTIKRMFRSFEYARSHAYVYVKHNKEERIIKSMGFQLLQAFYSILTFFVLPYFWIYYKIRKFLFKKLK
ncbi:MAG: glycosyltransferase family A protein [Candidatus Aenigmatarchaeota archaeon]|nr:glycosyltransferase family 2 protein [Candidatus Aenigmarchaeota archaeon]